MQALVVSTVFDLDNLLAARMLMAFTLACHIVLACLGVGMPVLMLFAEWRALRTGDEAWRALARRWSKAFAVLFAVGAVSGTVLSFELGLLWPEFMGTFGSVIGLPFTLEGFAFFLEGIFVGIYLYGWDRLGPVAHWLSGFPIAISGAASALFVVTANAWMNVPRGFTMIDGRVAEIDPIAAMLNPAAGPQTTHMIVAAYMVTGFLIASYYAACRLRGDVSLYTRRALTVSLALGAVFTPIQLVVGDWAARIVADTQPIKLAAMEGQFHTETRAPLRIGGWPNEQLGRTEYALEIPGGLSWLAYKNINATVRGLDDFPADERPPVVPVHIAFQLMVGIGSGLFLLALWSAVAWLRHRQLPSGKLFLWSVIVSGPLTVVALEAGWVVTEVGRQPWIVHGVMRTAEAVTAAPAVGRVLVGAVAIYLTLAASTIVVLRLLARAPLPETARGA